MIALPPTQIVLNALSPSIRARRRSGKNLRRLSTQTLEVKGFENLQSLITVAHGGQPTQVQLDNH